ncbi:MAG: tandem-95 repeat protein, partial [bacterium]|nr:tandem-95 repeat protein [bacterium]
MMVFFSQLSFAAVPAAEAAVESFYLKSEAVPQASLSSTAPVATVLANYDPARDAFPGIVIQKDGTGLGQTNPAAYQQWVAAAGSVSLDGPASLDIWAASKDFDTGKRGVIDAGLFDCASDGSDCDLIQSARVDLDPFNPSGDWTYVSFDFGSATHTVSPTRSLTVKVVADATSDDSMWFAYDTTVYPSQLQVTLATNNDPDAVDDSDATPQDTAVVIDVLANDSDPDTDPLTVDSVTQGSNGSVVNNGTDVTYTPNASWTGIDTFTYTVSDGNGGFDTGGVTVTVLPDSVLYADYFPTIAYDGSAGTTDWSPSPWVEVGDDDTVTGGSIFVETHTQNPTPDTPALKIKVDTLGVYVYRQLDLSGVSAAILEYDYHNEVDASGEVQLQISDDGGGSWTPLRTYAAPETSGTESIDISAYRAANTQIRLITTAAGSKHFRIDDLTVDVTAGNASPAAVDDSDSTPQDTAVVIDVLANDTDPETDPLTVDSVTQGSNGSVVNNSTDVTYTPNASWTGIDAFTYTASDGNGGFDTATVTVTVNPALAPVVLDQIQKGTATIDGGSFSTTATISAVDLTKSFLVFSVRENTSYADEGLVAGQLTDSTTVAFERNYATSTITIEWSVVEFASGVTVQRGSSTPSATVTDIPIAAVDLTRSFPIVSQRTSILTTTDGAFLQARFSATDNLELSTNQVTGNVFEWQVVQYNDAVVQSGDVSFASGDAVRTATVSSVDPTKSWLVYGYRTESSSNANIGEKLIRGQVTDSTTLMFDRSTTGTTNELSWFLVEFQDSTEVQHASVAFASSGTTQDVTISSVDPARSIAVGGYQMTGGRSPYTSDDRAGVAWFTLDLTASTNLQVQRDAALATADLGWFVVHWPVGPCSDSDSDGLCDLEEDANTDLDNDPATTPGPDTDGDTTPNYLDPDDDGDGTPTSAENADPNADGDPRDALDSDWDGQPDYLDLPITVASDGTVASEQKISDTVGGLSAVLDDSDNFGISTASIGDVDGDGI